ncbi:MAG: hypothetical protein LC768_18580 [Acidobacteria bacterium]|nr:hypothetical protein [Acidobacteriota bacterium]
MSLVCTERMIPIQEKVRERGTSWLSNYESDSNPGQLFDGVKQNVSILLHSSNSTARQHTTRLYRFFSEARNFVFPSVHYSDPTAKYMSFGFPKTNEQIEQSILGKLFSNRPLNNQLSVRSGVNIYVHRIAHYYIKCFDFVPYFRSDRDGVKKSEDYKEYKFKKPVELFVATINSSTFYFYWQLYFDSFKAGKQCVESFPCSEFGNSKLRDELIKHSRNLIKDLKSKSSRLRARYAATGNVEYDQFYPRNSKAIIDEIDRVLAKHYGFTDEELDFIINYDIKYRMGSAEAGGNDDE